MKTKHKAVWQSRWAGRFGLVIPIVILFTSLLASCGGAGGGVTVGLLDPEFSFETTLEATAGQSWTEQGTFNAPYGVTLDGNNDLVMVTEASHGFSVVDPDTGTIQAKTNVQGKIGDLGEDVGEFDHPAGVFYDAVNDHIYIADAKNQRIVRYTGTPLSFDSIIDEYEKDLVHTTFQEPVDVAVDAGLDRIYILDKAAGHVIVLDRSDNEFLFDFEGELGEEFLNPEALALDAAGNIYVADTENEHVKIFDINGDFIDEIHVENGNEDHGEPAGIAVSANGMRIFVAAKELDEVLEYDENGTLIRETGGTGPDLDEFDHPRHLFLDEGNDYLYVSDMNNHRVLRLDGTNITLMPDPFGDVLGPDTSPHATGSLNVPQGVAVDDNGNIFIADTNNHRIQVFDASQNFLVQAGTSGTGAQNFSQPKHLAVVEDQLFVLDSSNDRIQVLEPVYDAEGLVTNLEFRKHWPIDAGAAALFAIHDHHDDSVKIFIPYAEEIMVYDDEGVVLETIVRQEEEHTEKTLGSAGHGGTSAVPGIYVEEVNEKDRIYVPSGGEIVVYNDVGEVLFELTAGVGHGDSHKALHSGGGHDATGGAITGLAKDPGATGDLASLLFAATDEAILVFDTVRKEFVDSIATTDDLNMATQITVLDGKLYIADTNNQRVVVFDITIEATRGAEPSDGDSGDDGGGGGHSH